MVNVYIGWAETSPCATMDTVNIVRVIGLSRQPVDAPPVEGQAEWGWKQPGLVEGDSIHGRGVELDGG